MYAYQPSHAADAVPVRLLDVGRLWRHQRRSHDTNRWMPSAHTRCHEDTKGRTSVGYLAVRIRGTRNGDAAEMALADLVAFTVPALPADGDHAMRTLAHFDRSLLSHLTLTIVHAR